MELKLCRNTAIRELKKQFSKNFSFLKIEFFFTAHRSHEASSLLQKIPDHMLVAETGHAHREGVFSFSSQMSVGEFEQRLQDEFGLPVQVFRKSGDIWIETTQTDKLSLNQQNAMGEAANKPYRFNINSLLL